MRKAFHRLHCAAETFLPRSDRQAEMHVKPIVNLFQALHSSSATRPHRSGVIRWLTHLGPLGLFVVAVVDSSVIPMPVPGSTDLVLLWLVSHRGSPWMLVPIAFAGSMLGGYTTWHLGRKGGEAALQRYVPARFLNRIRGWTERHPILAVFVPAILPPPIPLSPFLLAAGLWAFRGGASFSSLAPRACCVTA